MQAQGPSGFRRSEKALDTRTPVPSRGASPQHLGFRNESLTPTYRGYDTFLGYYHMGEDYYTHRQSIKGGGQCSGGARVLSLCELSMNIGELRDLVRRELEVCGAREAVVVLR